MIKKWCLLFFVGCAPWMTEASEFVDKDLGQIVQVDPWLDKWAKSDEDVASEYNLFEKSLENGVEKGLLTQADIEKLEMAVSFAAKKHSSGGALRHEPRTVADRAGGLHGASFARGTAGTLLPPLPGRSGGRGRDCVPGGGIVEESVRVWVCVLGFDSEPGILPPFSRKGTSVVGQALRDPTTNVLRLHNRGMQAWNILMGRQGFIGIGSSIAPQRGLILSLGYGNWVLRVIE